MYIYLTRLVLRLLVRSAVAAALIPDAGLSPVGHLIYAGDEKGTTLLAPPTLELIDGISEDSAHRICDLLATSPSAYVLKSSSASAHQTYRS